MFNRISSAVIGMMLFSVMLYAAITQVNLASQASGVGAVANGMTGAATASAGTAFAGPVSGGAAAPSFKTLPTAEGIIPLPNNGVHFASCLAAGSGVTCLGLDSDSTWAHITATSTLPTYTVPQSDTTGASCTGRYPNVTGAATWYTGRNLTFETYASLGSTSGIRALVGLTGTGGLGACVETQPAANTALFRFSTTNPDTNFMCVTTDGDGVNSEVSDSGVAADTNFHKFKIWFDNANSNVKFYIDGALVCTNSTQIPVNQLLRNDDNFIVYCNTCGGVAKAWNVAWHTMQTTPF